MPGSLPARLAPDGRWRPGPSPPRCSARTRAAAPAPAADRLPPELMPTSCWCGPTACPTGSARPATWWCGPPRRRWPDAGGWCCSRTPTGQAANALLKAIEEPAPRTVWLLCAPSAVDLPTTIRSRCRLVTLRTPATDAGARALIREGVPDDQALAAALAAQGHIGRARRLAREPEARRRRAEVLTVPSRVSGLGQALSAAAALVRAADAEAAAVTGELDEPEREALRRAYGEGSEGKGVARALRGAAGAMKDLEDRQKSRATRVKRDSLDLALLDLAAFYRDVLAVQFGAEVELANPARRDELTRLAAQSRPETTVRRIEAIMTCRERLAASVAPLLAVEELTLALAR